MNISSRLLKANTEEEVSDIYKTCCVKIDDLLCTVEVEFFIADYVLCKTHYLIYLKNSYNKCTLKANKYSKDIVKIIKKISSNVKSDLVDTDNVEVIGKFNEIYIMKFKNKILKFCYQKNSPDLLRIDAIKFKEINLSIEYSLCGRYSAKKNIGDKFIIGKKNIDKIENIRFYLYEGVDYSLNSYMRYCSLNNKKKFILDLAYLVKKYHKKNYTIGHFSNLNIGIINDKPVFTSFFSFSTFSADFVEDFIEIDRCQNIMCDIITGSVKGLQLKFTDKFCDLEMIMWLYLYLINHPVIIKFKDKEGNLISLGKIIKIKQKFLLESYENGLLSSNDSNRNKFNIVKEVEKIINYF